MLELGKVKQRFLGRHWKSEDNKRLLNLVNVKRLNIEPACLYNLDQIGMNHLEIINFVSCIGKRFVDMPSADRDMLEYLQEKYNIIFNYDTIMRYKNKECKTHPVMTKLDSFVSHKVKGYWLKSSALLQLNKRYK